MKNPKKGKEKKRIGYNYLGMAGIMVIALVLLGSLMLQSKTLERRRDYYDSKATALEKSIESEKERTKEIEAEKEHMKTDEYVEEAAREKLGTYCYIFFLYAQLKYKAIIAISGTIPS